MNKHLVLTALTAAVLLAGCGGSESGHDSETGVSRLLATLSAGKPVTASVSAVNSTNATYTALSTLRVNQQAYFQVMGAKLPTTLALSVTDCAGMTTVSGTATEVRFKCTPTGTAGTKTVTVKDKTGGTTLYTGSVAVQEANPQALSTPFPASTYGFNLGNSLEAIWGYSIPGANVYPAAANAGFNAVRIPCAWDSNADPVTHQISADYMAKVKQAVDSSIAAGMYAVINVHWDGGWFDSHIDTVDPAVDAKVRAYWTQIAATFAGYDNHLLFAAANEPDVKSPTQMNTLIAYYQTFVNTVRSGGGNNPTRWLVLQGGGDTSWFTTLPTDSTPGRLMVEFHNYTPSLFTIIHTDQSWGNAIYFWGPAYHYAGDPTRNATFGEEGAIDAGFQQLKEQFVDKGIPVMVGEFQAAGTPGLTGTEQTYNNASRLYWNKFVAESARAHGLYPFYWSTPDAPFKYDTGAITDPALVTALTDGAAPPPPNGAPYAVTGVVATAGTGQVSLSWKAVSGATSYQIYRTAESGNEPATPSVTGITGTSYTDTGLNGGTTYYYRVVAVNSAGPSGFSTEAHATTPGVNPDPTKFHFETDTQLWTPSGTQISGIATSTAQHFAGKQSLAVTFSGAAAGTSSIDLSDVVVPAGATVTFHVWVPAGNQVTTIEPYLQDYNWAWTSAPYTSFTAGAWNTLTLTVPAGATTPLKRLGLRMTTAAGFTGTVYVDSINW
jgi:aryl-phospho-beta-D-glucosidase BglC (GH1 family)